MELWDLYDKNGNRTGEVWERCHGNYMDIPDGRYHLVSDILLQHWDGSYLLTKRHTGKDVYPGYWEASAGGSAQLGESPEECAKRELFEETGIVCDSFELVKKTFSKRSPSLIYSYLARVDCDKNAIVLQEGETTEYKWVDAAGLLAYAESELAIKSSVERYREYYDRVCAQLQIQCKNAGSTDAREIALLAAKMWTSHTVEELAESFAATINNPDCAVFLMTDGDKSVGFAQCGLRRDYVEGTTSSPVGYLEGIFVEEPYRKQGCAKRLLACCEQWAKEKQCTEFASDCEINNEISRQFHLGAGFREANRIICFVKKMEQ